jgi:hypothetical protein
VLGGFVTISELTKKLFGLMSKYGDLEVIGDVEVNKQLFLLQPFLLEPGLDKEDSEILPKTLTDKHGQDTSIYL